MAYVRRRGNQLSIVTGERNPETKKVEQRVLFTLYSKPEALEVLGRGKDKSAATRFEMLMKDEHPDVAFNWKTIRKAIAADLGHLPEEYAYKEERLTGRFREDLVTFARSLMLADPQHLEPAGALIRENRDALAYLQELIAWRLKTCEVREPDEWTSDNPFFWRFAMQGNAVPPDAEEFATAFWEKRDLVRAEGAFKVMVGAFPPYAEGWNYLGLIALERKNFALAEEHFGRCIELGRKLFPKRIARSSYWQDHKTRPYMRGLRNLTLTLNRAGKYDAALAIADQLETECGDDLAASSYRARIAMNTGDWKLAAESASRLGELWPDESILEAFARFELGERARALEVFLRGALTHPRAVRLVLGLSSKDPTTGTEGRDHNAGVYLLQMLGNYFGKKDRSARTFFTRVLGDERVAQLVQRAEELRGQRFGHPRAERAIFDELTRMETSGFAKSQAGELRDLVGQTSLANAAAPNSGRIQRTSRPRGAAENRATRRLH